MAGLTPADAWAAVTRAFGATADAAAIDAARTIAATRRGRGAGSREVAAARRRGSRSRPRARRRC